MPPRYVASIPHAVTSFSRIALRLSCQSLDIGRDVVGLRSAQCKIHPAVRSDQIEKQRFSIKAVLSSDREEGRSVRNEIVAGTAGHDVTGGAALLGQPSAALHVGSLSLQGRKSKRETTGNAIHEPPPILLYSFGGEQLVRIDPDQQRPSIYDSRPSASFLELHPRHVVPKPARAYEPEMPVKVRECQSHSGRNFEPILSTGRRAMARSFDSPTRNNWRSSDLTSYRPAPSNTVHSAMQPDGWRRSGKWSGTAQEKFILSERGMAGPASLKPNGKDLSRH